MIRFLDAGESHGKALIAIIEGIPSNFSVNLGFINNELKRRQQGYGRGARMSIENDRVELWSGVRGGKTTGNPITMVIFNKDYENWKDIIENTPSENERITIPRPGHGDFVGYFKYRTGDIRNTIERTSARETAIRTAVGALCKCILKELGIDVRGKVASIGEIRDEAVDMYDENKYRIIEKSPVRIYNIEKEKEAINAIEQCRLDGDTIGGSIFVSVSGVPVGIGSYSQWDRKLDGILSCGIMSIQGIKAVEFGNGLNLALRGSDFNDELFFNDGKILRDTNNSGGIEAGVSNGENIEFTAYMKPIPTIRKSIASIDLKEKTNVVNRYERSDLCAVVPAAVVVENVCAFHILDELTRKFPADCYEDLRECINNYRDRILKD